MEFLLALLKKHPFFSVLAVALGFIICNYIGDAFKLPRIYGEELTFVNAFIYSSVIYSFLFFMQKVINKLRQRMKSISGLNALRKKNVEKIKSQVDDFTNSEYSVVMDLLKSNNTVPYIEYSMPKPGTILSDNTWFVRSPCNKKVFKKITTENGQVITVKGISQYKLTPSKYRELKYIYAKTGSISHFKREY